MADVFARTEVDFGGAMHAQFGVIQAGSALTGVLMQNIQLSYQQQVTRIYELGTAGQKTKVYYIGGRSQGTMGIAHVIGPGISMANFYKTFGDVCNAKTNTVTLNLGPNICDGANPQVYTCRYCVLMSIGVSMAAQDFVMNENSQMMFSAMDFGQGG